MTSGRRTHLEHPNACTMNLDRWMKMDAPRPRSTDTSLFTKVAPLMVMDWVSKKNMLEGGRGGGGRGVGGGGGEGGGGWRGH